MTRSFPGQRSKRQRRPVRAAREALCAQGAGGPCLRRYSTRSLGIPHRRVQKLIRIDRDEVMVWAKRWLQDAQDQGIDVKADPASEHGSLLHALASLPV